MSNFWIHDPRSRPAPTPARDENGRENSLTIFISIFFIQKWERETDWKNESRYTGCQK